MTFPAAFLLLTAALSSFSLANAAPLQSDEATPKALVIYALEIQGLHQADGNGEYDAIINGALANYELPVKIEIMPPARSFRNFETCENCCMSPASSQKEFYDFSAIFESAPMNIAKLVVFTPDGTTPIATIAQLEGLRVSARHGMLYGKTIEQSGLVLIRANTIVGNIKMMEAGRIDAFLAFIPDAYDAFRSLDQTPTPHDPENPLLIHRDSVICRGELGSEFIAHLDKFLAALGGRR